MSNKEEQHPGFADLSVGMNVPATDDLKISSVDFIESLPAEVRKRVEDLVKLQKKHDEFIEAWYLEERPGDEDIYHKHCLEWYSKRFRIVCGLVEKGDTLEFAEGCSLDVKGVPDFWLRAMKMNKMLAPKIKEPDEDALKFLGDIHWSKLTDGDGFKLDFFFCTNPYFKNHILSRTFILVDQADGQTISKGTWTEIVWKPGKRLTREYQRMKTKKKLKKTEHVNVRLESQSFFDLFDPPYLHVDRNQCPDLQNDLALDDYDFGCVLRDYTIPYAVSWYTGEAAEQAYDKRYEDEDEEYECKVDEEIEDGEEVLLHDFSKMSLASPNDHDSQQVGKGVKFEGTEDREEVLMLDPSKMIFSSPATPNSQHANKGRERKQSWRRKFSSKK